MTEPKKTDPALAPHLASIACALESDSADPAAILAAVETGLAGIRAARAPGVKNRAIEKATKALRSASEALARDQSVENLVSLRAAGEMHRKAHGLPAPKAPRKRYGLGDALAERPPPKSVCKKLEWEVGRPPMLVGAPGAGKTYAIQAAYIDLMIGRSLWGCPEFRVPGPCRVLHVDLDQGAAKTLRRHRRLLRGHGVELTAPSCADTHEAAAERMAAEHSARRQLGDLYDLDPRDMGTFQVDEGEGLALMSLMPEELARWKAAWIDAVSGFDACFVDSLRRLAPFLDENDSRFSVVPDVLRVVSEAAQCVIVLLHHASNKVRQVPGARAAKAPAGTRGSSAIDGAAGSQLVIEEDDDARKVSQSRAGEAAKLPPFWLTFVDEAQPGPGGVRGLRVAFQTREEATKPKAEAKAEAQRALVERILAYVSKMNRGTAKTSGYGPGRKQVVKNVEGNDAGLYAAVEMLVKERRLVEIKDNESKAKGLWTPKEEA